jgi:DNA-binding MarR family transcriptional regulator
MMPEIVAESTVDYDKVAIVRGIDDERLAVWAAFLRAHANVTGRLERELVSERGLSLSWYDVLLQLRLAGGQLRMQELARSVLLSKSGLTRLVDRMEAAGLVARRSCSSDRRGTFVTLTAEGRDALRAAAPVHLRGIEEHFLGLLDQTDLRALRTALEKVAGQDAPAADLDPRPAVPEP